MVTTFSRWQWIRGYIPGLPWRVALEVEEADEIPERLPRRAAVIVPNKWLAFYCPCWTGHQIMVNLATTRRPAWKVLTESPLSVIPSVDERAPGRRCHYVINHGYVHWVQREHSK